MRRRHRHAPRSASGRQQVLMMKSPVGRADFTRSLDRLVLLSSLRRPPRIRASARLGPWRPMQDRPRRAIPLQPSLSSRYQCAGDSIRNGRPGDHGCRPLSHPGDVTGRRSCRRSSLSPADPPGSVRSRRGRSQPRVRSEVRLRLYGPSADHPRTGVGHGVRRADALLVETDFTLGQPSSAPAEAAVQ